MTISSQDPSARHHGAGARAGESPLLDRTSEIPALIEVPARNGDRAGVDGGWQSELWRRVRHRPGRGLLVGLAFGVIIGLPVGDAVAQGTTTYSSQSLILLDSPMQIASSGDAGALIKLDDLRYKYASLASTDAIAQPVAANIHVPVSVVLSAASVQVPPNALLIEVVGKWTTPGFAHEVSQAMANGIVQYIETENTTYNIPQSDQFTANIVSPASAAVASRPSKTHALAVGLLALVGAGLLAFFVFQGLTADPLARRRR